MPRKRTDAGTFAETVSLDDVLAVFDTIRGPVITSSDVAEHLECTTEAARQKLTRLYDQGLVDKRKTGRTTVWWQPKSDEDGREAGVSPATAARDRTDPSPLTPSSRGGERPERGAQVDVRATVEALDLQGAGQMLEAREDALVEIVETLREEGSATAKELKNLVDPDVVGYKDADVFWANMRSQDVFDPLPVETPGRGGRTYTYTGGDR